MTQLVEQSMARSRTKADSCSGFKQRRLTAMMERDFLPYWGISGSSEDDDRGGALLLSVRSRLERGVLRGSTANCGAERAARGAG